MLGRIQLSGASATLRASRAGAHARLHRSRESVADVLHTIIVPDDVYPTAPADEQKAPACTIGPLADVVLVDGFGIGRRVVVLGRGVVRGAVVRGAGAGAVAVAVVGTGAVVVTGAVVGVAVVLVDRDVLLPLEELDELLVVELLVELLGVTFVLPAPPPRAAPMPLITIKPPTTTPVMVSARCFRYQGAGGNAVLRSASASGTHR